MVFSSYVFLFWLLPVALAVYYALPRARTVWLIAASYVFYGWARFDYVALILFSSLLDAACARGLASSTSPGRRKALLTLSVVTNLGLLGFFKYFNFAVDVADAAAAAVGAGPVISPWPDIVLPVGISFYTFQSMSYTIDVYRGVVPPARRLSAFLCYVALFPQLVAGPIVRYRDLAEQLEHRTHSLEMVGRGVFCFMLGFAKKTLLANNVGPLADALFDRPGVPGLLDSWTGVLAYTFQIYFDFSGYSDMAIGLGLMLGFTLPRNFASPYRADSITEFWRRWHISLSSWLRDYLYIPLGGNQKGPLRTYVNLVITMLLGGLWHGASWTFVLWGAWHGVLLALERLRGRPTGPVSGTRRTGRRALTFGLVMVGWIGFRATDAAGMGTILAGLFGGHGLGDFTLLAPASGRLALVALILAAGVAFFGETTENLARRPGPVAALGATVAFAFGVAQMLLHDFNPFLYFRF